MDALVLQAEPPSVSVDRLRPEEKPDDHPQRERDENEQHHKERGLAPSPGVDGDEVNRNYQREKKGDSNQNREERREEGGSILHIYLDINIYEAQQNQIRQGLATTNAPVLQITLDDPLRFL
jgi:hypothetical protein